MSRPATGPAILGRRCVPSDQQADQRRSRSPPGHQRRVDRQAHRDQGAPDRRPRRHASSRWAIDAGGKALAAAGVQPSDVDLVIAVSCTVAVADPGHRPADRRPASASRQAGSFDLNAGCAGFCYGAVDRRRRRPLGQRPARAGGRHRAADRLGRPRRPRHGHPLRRRRRRGAGRRARRGGCLTDPAGIGPVAWGSDGGAARPSRSASATTGDRSWRWRARRSSAGPPPSSSRSRSGPASWPASRPASSSAIVLHQANLRITESIARSLGAPAGDPRPRHRRRPATPPAASVPLALSRLIDEGQVGSGDAVLLFAFGAGLTYAGQVVRLP